jgi:hypothetical protein
MRRLRSRTPGLPLASLNGLQTPVFAHKAMSNALLGSALLLALRSVPILRLLLLQP